jgi:hypothetical protein
MKAAIAALTFVVALTAGVAVQADPYDHHHHRHQVCHWHHHHKSCHWE